MDATEPKGQPPVLGAVNSVPLAAQSNRGWWVALALLGTAGLGILHTFSPERFGFYPQCGLHAWTGLHCPGCGSLRALHHLTHGRLAAAADSNALLMFGLAVGVFWCVTRLIRRRPLIPSACAPRPRTVLLFLGGVVVFGVLRNLPWQPFAVLAP